jgi:flagellar motility protein MotE (MotC chaperone)
LAKCQFTTEYYDYESKKMYNFECEYQEALETNFCIFHNKDYLQDKNNIIEYKQRVKEVKEKLNERVKQSISHNELLLCIGYHLQGAKSQSMEKV